MNIEVTKKPDKNFLKNVIVKTPEDVYKLEEIQEIKDAIQEHLIFIGMNNANEIRNITLIGVGNSNGISINSKDILRTALLNADDKVILVHNHPSNSLKPSKEDINLSNITKQFLKVFNIQLLDHIIVAENDYISMEKLNSIDKNYENEDIKFVEKTLLLEENLRLKKELEMKGEKKYMNKYESVIILNPNMKEEEKKNLLENYSKHFESLSSNPVKTEDLGIKKLAYEIQNNKEGSYAVFHYCANSEDISEISRKFRIDENVMKFITVKEEENVEENNAEMQEQEDKEMEF